MFIDIKNRMIKIFVEVHHVAYQTGRERFVWDLFGRSPFNEAYDKLRGELSVDDMLMSFVKEHKIEDILHRPYKNVH